VIESNGLKAVSGTIAAPHERDWVNKNLGKLIKGIMKDVRLKKPLPFSITMNGIAYAKFVEMLKSRHMFFPPTFGPLKFLEIPVFLNNTLPPGTFVVDRFSNGPVMPRKR